VELAVPFRITSQATSCRNNVAGNVLSSAYKNSKVVGAFVLTQMMGLVDAQMPSSTGVASSTESSSILENVMTGLMLAGILGAACIWWRDKKRDENITNYSARSGNAGTPLIPSNDHSPGLTSV
jgi:hypothetical protein